MLEILPNGNLAWKVRIFFVPMSFPADESVSSDESTAVRLVGAGEFR